MAIDATYPRSRARSHDPQRFALFAIGAAFEIAAVVLILIWHGSPSRVFGVVILLATIGCFALGPRATLLTLAGLWGIVHSILSATDLGGSVSGQNLNLSRGLGAAIVVGGGLALLNLVRQGVRLVWPLKAAVLFLALYTLDTVIAPSHSAAFADLVRVASGVFVGLVAYYVIDTRQRLLLLSRVVFICGVIVALTTIFQFALARVDPAQAVALFGASSYAYSFNANLTQAAVRVFGPLGGPGETAGFLLVAAAFGLLHYSLVRDTGRKTGYQVLGIIVICIAILATLTRASTAGLLILILFWVLQRQSRVVSSVGTRMKVLALVAAVTLAAIPLIGSQNLHARIWDLNPSTSGASFAQGRAAIWSLDLAKLKASTAPELLLGHGGHTAYVSMIRAGQLSESSPHNLLIWLMLETGLVGTFLYLGFLFGAGRVYLTASMRSRYAYAGQVGAVALATLVAYQAQGMFTLSPNSPGHGLYFMMFVGATLRACVGAPSEDSVEGRHPAEIDRVE